MYITVKDAALPTVLRGVVDQISITIVSFLYSAMALRGGYLVASIVISVEWVPVSVELPAKSASIAVSVPIKRCKRMDGFY